jgi:hypothetical protein
MHHECASHEERNQMQHQHSPTALARQRTYFNLCVRASAAPLDRMPALAPPGRRSMHDWIAWRLGG